MSYRLEPLMLKDDLPSDKVFFLCHDDVTPLQQFIESCKDRESITKMARAIESVHNVGIPKSIEAKRLKQIKGTKDNDLYEITTNNCVARAYCFMLGNQEAIAISFIKAITHRGKGQKDVQNAKERLRRERENLDEAIKNGENNG